MLDDFFHRRGGGLARTMIVAVATLAILLVCFSMYQQSQLHDASPMSPRGPRLPAPGAGIPAAPVTTGQPAGVTVDGAVIGASRDVTITLYKPGSRDSNLELTVSNWSPKGGSDHEFELRDPEIRMRTAEGNDVRVKAQEGLLEARRKSGSGLEPQRGRLSGDVVVEFDRRTQEEKEKLPESQRNKADDHDIVRVQAASLEFDVEFGRLTIPGKVILTARDAGLEAFDVEVQFNRHDDRIESLRIERGGRIELHSRTQGLGMSSGDQGAAPQRQTLVDWMRNTLQARMDAQDAASKASMTQPDSQKARTPGVVESKEPSLPVFRATTPPRARTAARYVGRFEGDVDARQQLGDATQSRLEADWLEIVRELALDDEKKSQPPQAVPAAASTTGSTPESAERMVLTWTGKLLVTQADGGDSHPSASQLTAGGSPARLSHPEGDAHCSRLVYQPETGALQLEGDGLKPVVARSIRQGIVMGESISLRRNQEAIDIVVHGSGRLWEQEGPPDATTRFDVQAAQLGPPSIEFAEGLKATGRIREKTSIDFTGTITTRQYRMLDRVTFGGRTTLRQDDTSLEADSIQVGFSETESWGGLQQSIDRVVGEDNVVMTQKADRLVCDRIEIDLAKDTQGKTFVETATAYGSVSAVQDDQLLTARDKMIVDFEPSPSAPAQVNNGTDPAPSQAEARPGDATGLDIGKSASPRRLRAYGEVTVVDPSQGLDLSCEQLDCAIAAGKDTNIETAIVRGLPERPAHVKLNTLSVTGNDITIDVAGESADVPGAGRMTILSNKDLDGRKVDPPIPVAVTWTEEMKYRGRENRATFAGNVHASSQATTTFDCANLLVEFDDVDPNPLPQEKQPGLLESWGLRGPIDAVLHRPKKVSSSVTSRFTKEPRYIEATGNAVAQTAELHATGAVKSRARISGPKLSLHLRSELSKLLIEGAGDLLLEDFQPAEKAPSPSQDVLRADLFSDESDSGPSKTLIEWRDRMWYDFGIDQTLFEGDVKLMHLSGAELDKVFDVPAGSEPNTAKGRRTFLDADVLTVDFADAPRSARRPADQRMGRISSDRLRRFQANGRVALREEVDQFSLSAEEVTYERPRKILLIQGAPHRKAQLVRHRTGKLPDQMAAQRIFFNLETGQIDMSGPRIRTGQ